MVLNFQTFVEGKNSGCIEFARAELEKYIGSSKHNNFTESVKIILRKDAEDNVSDAFSISVNEDGFILCGSNDRSVLFAVYTFLEEYMGMRWLHADGRTIFRPKVPHEMKKGTRKYIPDFKFRGLCMENETGQLELIDWMAKNRMNYALITLKSWKSMEEKIVAEIEKRDIILALGGHSYLKFLDPEIYFQEHPEWYALINGKRVNNGQMCFANKEGTRKLFENIYECLKHIPAIKRLSLWPIDNRHYCQCDWCRKKSFLELNCRLMGDLEKYLHEKGIRADVEHTAYNASLSREMFNVPIGIETFLNADTELAYWGRDYSHSIAESHVETDRDAWSEICKWSKVNKTAGRKFLIIEYYTDFWMMTTVFPVLAKVIAKDMRHYHEINLDGITTLIVPSDAAHGGRAYPWMKWMELNMHVFAKYCWNVSLEIDEVLSDYFSSRFGKAAPEIRRFYEMIEDNAAALTYFNIPLFRLRLCDIWVRDVTPADGGISFVAEDWKPELGYKETEQKRWEFTRMLHGKLEKIETCKLGAGDEMKEAVEYLNYIKLRVKSLYLQQKAQMDMINENWKDVKICLSEALSIEDSLYGENSKECRKWLEFLEHVK